MGGEHPPELDRWMIAFKTHWTLDVIDALAEEDYRQFFAIRDGMTKAGVWQNV